MISLTRKSDYALVALACLGKQMDECTCDEAICPISARAIADEYDLPRDVVMSLLKDLQRAGLVESERGAKGGYFLARSPEQITVAEVVEAIEGPARLAPCCAEEEADELCTVCSLVTRCPITGGIREINGQITDFLRRVTLRMLMQHGRKPLPSIGAPAIAKS